jgi:HK97 gp10 family phage protein
LIDVKTSVVGAEAVQAKFTSLSATVHERVRKRVQALGIALLRKVKEEKLSGQVLNVRTGNLRRNINEDTTISGDRIASSVGTNVRYARYWELGFRGTEQVKAHLRRGHPVRAFSRTVQQGARPFLSSALQEMRGRIIEDLTLATKEPT